MLNNELNSLQDVLAILKNYDNYETYIEVSPELYIYLRQQCEQIDYFNKDILPETLYGCKILLNLELKGYEYNIVRKERDYAK